MALVTLTTDFGLTDPYVAEMKGVIIGACPSVRLVDVTHDVSPGDLAEASWVLDRVWERFPPGTVHLAVIDPGVGSSRLPVAVSAGERWFVGPDNGILDGVVGRLTVDKAIAIEASRVSADRPSDTFHGRDLFAPAAARIACGAPADELGRPLSAGRLVRLETEGPEREGSTITGHVVHVDRFGNLITDIPTSWLPTDPSVHIAGRVVEGLRHSYSAVAPADLVLTLGSGGMLEVSARGTSAAALLGVGRGETVTVSGA